MISVREILYGLYGAYRLCRLDPQGLAFLDDSDHGFWRSFVAALLIAPAHFLITALELQTMPVQADVLRVVLIEIAQYVVLVFAYPVLMYSLCRLLDRELQYHRYIVAYNWAGVVQMAFVFPGAVLALSGALPGTLANFVLLGVTAVSVVMLWYIAKAALHVAGYIAAVLVTVDVVLSKIVQGIADARLAIG